MGPEPSVSVHAGRWPLDQRRGDELRVREHARSPLLTTLDIDQAKVLSTLSLGEIFQFTFDLGDNWVHHCAVADSKIDPIGELGIRPTKPLPSWGWGSIPDQYGRRWDTDDGEGPIPPRPAAPHPMTQHEWPGTDVVPPLDMRSVRAAIAQGDAPAFLAAVAGREVDHALQQIGAGIPMALQQHRNEAQPIAGSIINRLLWRQGTGDEVLAEDLDAHLRREPLEGQTLPVDLGMLSSAVEGDPMMSSGCFVDRHTGDVLPGSMADPMMVGEDAAVDVEGDPDRWLWLDTTGSREGWQDMADFAAQQQDCALREQLETAIEGKGAFQRFRDALHQMGLSDNYNAFATDRQWGRARELLAAHGIRASTAG